MKKYTRYYVGRKKRGRTCMNNSKRRENAEKLMNTDGHYKWYSFDVIGLVLIKTLLRQKKKINKYRLIKFL